MNSILRSSRDATFRIQLVLQARPHLLKDEIVVSFEWMRQPNNTAHAVRPESMVPRFRPAWNSHVAQSGTSPR
jgi:hypothetical protein